MTLDEIKDIASKIDKNTSCGELCDLLFAQDPGCIYYKFIFKLLEKIQPTASVELGVCTGRCTAHIAGGCSSGKVFGIDPSPYEIGYIIAKYPNITLLRGRSDDPKILAQIPDKSLDFCFVDSDHSGRYTASEVRLWKQKLKPNGIFLFDDIYLNASMTIFWDQLNLPKINIPGQHLTGPNLDKDVGFGCAICP
jgi:SAM-dependent methyltransferase